MDTPINPYMPPTPSRPVDQLAEAVNNEPIVALVHFDADFLSEALARLRSISIIRRIFRFIRALTILLLIVWVLFAVWEQIYEGAVIPAIALIFLLTSKSLDRLLLRRKMAGSPYNNDEIRIELSADGFHATSAQQDVRLQWSVFTTVVYFNDGILLRQGQSACNWIPFKAIQDATRIEDLRRLIESHVPTKIDLRA